ncbi:MAG: hypothetical protein ABEJ04_03665 [Halobacteriaceae archaeon]
MSAPLRVEEYWDWAAVALFLLVPLDLLTTLYAAAEVGVAAESNPLVRWALARGVLAVVALNLAAVVLVAALFAGVLRMLERTPPPHDRRFGRLIEAWLGLLVVAGLAVFANNLSVIVYGRGLL